MKLPAFIGTCVVLALTSELGVRSQDLAGGGGSPLPAPTGSFSVGRTHFDWTDDARPDPENLNGHREIVAWAWYPASSGPTGEPAAWMPGSWAGNFWSDFIQGRPDSLGGVTEATIGALRTHGYDEAPLPPGSDTYPIVLFAPGLGTSSLEYAGLLEDVASHGYVVVGIVPTYVARFAVFADGRVVAGRDVPAIATTKAVRPTTEVALRQFAEVVDLARHDLSFALDQLARLNADRSSRFRGRLDVTRVGAVGHSLGGAAALQVTHEDPRIRGVVDIDGSPIWAATGALAKPLLVLSAASTPLSYDAALSGATPGLHLRITGTVHTFSSDVRVVLAPRIAPAQGSIDPVRAIAITGVYTTAFFDRYLRGAAADLLKGPSPRYPEVVFER